MLRNLNSVQLNRRFQRSDLDLQAEIGYKDPQAGNVNIVKEVEIADHAARKDIMNLETVDLQVRDDINHIVLQVGIGSVKNAGHR